MKKLIVRLTKKYLFGEIIKHFDGRFDDIEEMIMKTQQDINDLTKRVESNSAGIRQAIQNEADEIRTAIESNSIDTTALEQAVADNEKLAAAVSDIFTPNTNQSDAGNTDAGGAGTVQADTSADDRGTVQNDTSAGNTGAETGANDTSGNA